MKFKKELTVKEIADGIGAQIWAPSFGSDSLNNIKFSSVAKGIEIAEEGDIAFLANPKYKSYLESTKAAAVILTKDYVSFYKGISLITDNPRLALAKLLNLIANVKVYTLGVSESVKIGTNCDISSGVSIADNCVIGNNVTIKSGVVLMPGVVIGDNCVIKENSKLYPNVILYDNVSIGKNSIIHAGTVVGSDGFGYANDSGNWIKMPHFGGVKIGNNVEVGANTCIDRGFLGDTIIESNVIIDNLVQLAHNVVVGSGTAIAACSGIAGSTEIGKYCLIGGGAKIAGHLEITDYVNITASSNVNKSIRAKGTYSSGLPAKENHTWRRNVARFQYLDSMDKRIKQLEKLFAAQGEDLNV